VLNNPVRHTDPTGHNPLIFLYALTRVGYDVEMALLPDRDRLRRDQIGGQLVTQLSDTISHQAATHGLDPSLVSAILRHEGAAIERRALTPWPSVGPGVIANTAEAVQVLIQGDTASIGPGQMQLRRARELEQLGYVSARGSDHERIQALLNQDTSVEYVIGMVHYLSDQLHATFPDFRDLSGQDQQRVILIGYNIGWEGEQGLRANIEKHGFWRVIERFDYDNQTLDEYLRWRTRP